MNVTGYRVEKQGESWKLFFIRANGSEFLFGTYQDEQIARYDGIRGSQRKPTTDDGWRARRQSMRSWT